MKLTGVSHARLSEVVERWRNQQDANERMIALDPTGQRRVLANAYRQCANDLDLVLRDDATLQPRQKAS